MFFIRMPSNTVVDEFLASQRSKTFSYSQVGSTREHLPAGYTIDHNRAELGKGIDVFRRARLSFQTWQMFKLGWVELFPPDTPIEPGVTVATRIRHLGFWSLNACRIVYVIEEERRYGFAYGTLEDHAEQGEERFLIESLPHDDSVWYDIVAFSRPRVFAAKLGKPFARVLQKRFVRDSKAAIRRAVATMG